MQPSSIITPPAPAVTLAMATKMPSQAGEATANYSIISRDVKRYDAPGNKISQVISSGFGLIGPVNQGKA